MASRQRSTAGVPERPLSLTENVVLAVVCEGTTHGFALARLLGRDGAVGQVFHVPRPLVYRALDRLLARALVGVEEVQDSPTGPQRTRYRATPRGRAAAGRWLSAPVAHVRDVRTEFLVKLVLAERAGTGARDLVNKQLQRVRPIVHALEAQSAAGAAAAEPAEGVEAVVNLWRLETARATLRFLEQLAPDPPPTPT